MKHKLKEFFKSFKRNKTNKNDTIEIDDIFFDITYKEIKNVYLRVLPPKGKVTISVPRHMTLDSIRAFAITRLSWIKKQRSKLLAKPQEKESEYISREAHYYLGKSYLLNVIEHKAIPRIVLKHDTIEMHIRPNSDIKKREKLLNEWYRQKLKELIPEIIAHYEKIMNVTVSEFGVKKMKTRWGTCNIFAKRIWLNLELAKKPREHIEYVVVHEMVHLLERRHNKRFSAFMTQFLPYWRSHKNELNRIAIKLED